VYSVENCDLVLKRLEELGDGIAKAMRCTIEWTISNGYPAVVNHEENVNYLIAAANRVVGEDKVKTSDPSSAGEDFSYFLKERPGCFWFISIGKDKNFNHSANYDFDDDILPSSVEIYAALIEERFGFRFLK
jgi:metal-dependent amidase/aminoacylase/carboxypeptidase family protein